METVLHEAQIRALRRMSLGERMRLNASLWDHARALKEAFRQLYRKGLNTSDALAVLKEAHPECAEVRDLIEFIESSERGIIR